MQKSSYLLFPRYLYHLRYSSISVYDLFIRKYLFITALLQPFMCYSTNLVGIPRSSSSSSLFNHLALSIPILGLFITFCTSTLSFIRPNIANLQSSFCSYHIIIYCLNLSILFFWFPSSKRIFKVVLLFNYYVNFPTFRLNTMFTQNYHRPHSFFKILVPQKSLSYAYLFIFKLNYYPYLLVIIRYKFLGMSYLILRILSILYLVLRILSLQPFTFSKQ